MCAAAGVEIEYDRHGELATNVQLTEHIVRVIREMDMEPATPAEARELMGLQRRGIVRPEFAPGRACTSSHPISAPSGDSP